MRDVARHRHLLHQLHVCGWVWTVTLKKNNNNKNKNSGKVEICRKKPVPQRGKQRGLPIIPHLYAVEANGAVGPEQDHHVSEEVEQESI